MTTLTPDQIRTMRTKDAEAVQRCLTQAKRAMADLTMAVGVWCDDVNADAQDRNGADTPSEVLWAEADYKAALNAVGLIADITPLLDKAKQEFDTSEEWAKR